MVPWIFCCSFDAISAKRSFKSDINYLHCLFYTLLGFKVALGIVSGVSAEMIAASFNQSIPTSTGNAMPGYLQNLLWFSAIGIPIGQVGMQGKRLLQFHHNKSLQKTFGQKRGMRDSGNGNSRMI